MDPLSKQYTGPKPTDDQQPVDLPEGKKVLIFCFNVLLKGEKGSARSIEDAVEDMRPLMLLVFYFVDKVRLILLWLMGSWQNWLCGWARSQI